jgi:hypothetical protein
VPASNGRSRAVAWKIFRVFVLAAAMFTCYGVNANAATYATPEDAISALVDATRTGNPDAMLAVLGKGAKGLVESGDPVADRTALEKFNAEYAESSKLTRPDEKTAMLSIGKDDWPFPIPVVKTAKGWQFDVRKGADEIMNRRIGRNELAVMQVMRAYVDAQREYYSANPASQKLLQYAQKFSSTAGKRDGLYYPTAAGEPPSPLGELFAHARAAGYKPGESAQPVPYYGYYYRMLTGQGRNAPGGAYDYVVRGQMIGGFALIAYPAKYGNSGVMTFIVNQDGVVYQKNLGPKTPARAARITRFDPDDSWKRESN